jgi:apolipoprotein N-acyltransferase
LAFLASTLYIAIDYIYANIYLAPTGRFAGSLAYDTHFLQLARLTGHSGLTFVLIFANIVIASALINSRQFKSHIPALLAVFLIFIAVYFYGSHCLNNSPSAGKIEEFAIIQGGITKEQYDAMEISQSSWKFVINRYFDMTTEAKQMGYNNIFWPETAIRSYVGIKDTLTSFVNTSDINLIGGFPLLIGSTNVQYNSVLSLDNNANIIGRYDKNHLLPFTENEFLSGEKSEPIKTKFGALVTPICLEGLFPNHIRSMVNKGGEAIVIFTNDSGFGQNAISALVLKQIFLRAVENNRYVVRVAQSGISALIDNFGQIIAQSSLMSREIIPVEFKLINQASLYGKLGEWFLLSTVFLSLSILLYSQRF